MDRASNRKLPEDMNKTEKLAELRSLQTNADSIRQELGISQPGKILFLSSLGSDNDVVVVEADGFGGATTSVVEGNYPIDYVTKFERFLPSEQDAEAAAEELSFEGAAPMAVLGTPA
jgi:hypothetical protein